MSPSAGGAEQRVGDRVQHHVGVGVADEALRVRDDDPAEDERPAFGQPVRVVSAANAIGHCEGPRS